MTTPPTPAVSQPSPSAPSQPISAVRWMPREDLSSNSYNPNSQAPPERRLLRRSILESGWTQPIVARDHGDRLEIVDGYHRWLTSEDPKVYALTNGLVPVVVLPPTDDASARLATVRHNRARGTHHVLGMATVVSDLIALGLDEEAVRDGLGMDDEEVERLADRGDMLKRHGTQEFGKGWTVQ